MSSVLALAALTVAGVVVHREVSSRPARPATESPVYVEGWKSLVGGGLATGAASPRVQVVEFADFQCPACRSFNTTLVELERTYRGSLASVFVHFPLPQHREAIPAARAAECAALQRRFAEFRNTVFAQQDSLGVKNWSGVAIAAGVTDTATFNQCLTSDSSMARITAGLALGRTYGVRGTPTVIVNGWRFRTTPTLPELKTVIDQLLRGERPKL